MRTEERGQCAAGSPPDSFHSNVPFLAARRAKSIGRRSHAFVSSIAMCLFIWKLASNGGYRAPGPWMPEPSRLPPERSDTAGLSLAFATPDRREVGRTGPTPLESAGPNDTGPSTKHRPGHARVERSDEAMPTTSRGSGTGRLHMPRERCSGAAAINRDARTLYRQCAICSPPVSPRP